MKSFFALFLGLISASALAEPKVVLYVDLTPAGSFQAVSKKVKGDFKEKDGVITSDKIWVSVESFTTENSLRDTHFHKHLNSSKCPKAIMKNLKAKDGTATGDLEVNCISKPVKGISYKVNGAEAVAKFEVKGSDYNLPKAAYLGVGVSDLIKVEVTVPSKTK